MDVSTSFAPAEDASGWRTFRREESTIAWVVEHTRGPSVALVGCPDKILLLSLLSERHRVAAYVPEPSVLDEWLASLAVDDRDLIDVTRERALTGDRVGKSADTVIVIGWPTEIGGPDGVLRSIRERLGSVGSRLLLVLPNFAEVCLRENEFDIAGFVSDARRLTVPEQMSLIDEALVFVGEFGGPGPGVWRRFEQVVWPGLLRDAVRSVGLRRRREVEGLRQRLGRLRGLISSTSYRVGTSVVTAANRPQTLIWLPAVLWRLYRSRRNRLSGRRGDSRQRTVFPSMLLPHPGASDRPVVAAILDTFSDYCLRYELDLVRLTPEGWRREIDKSSPAFLLVESAWTGNEGRWRGLIVHNQSLELNPLRDLVAYCRTKEIKTVFWNKEDPPNFDFFIAAAIQFDVIFTSDSDCVQLYRDVHGHHRVFEMPFAAQPRIHNPCRGEDWPRYPVCFAGSWRGDAYEERTESVPILLDPALSFGLHIMDRNLKRVDTRPNLRFPDRYQGAIKGSLNYEQMLTAYRCYDVMLNVNSVTASPTMFSRRVFEALACATPVVSLDSVGMRLMLGEHVRVARTMDETSAHLGELLTDDEARVREGHLAYRHVHQHHTYRHRVDMIFQEVGIALTRRRRPVVSMIVALRNTACLASVLADFAAQVYLERELLVVIADRSAESKHAESKVREVGNADVVYAEAAATLSARLNRGIAEARGEYVAIVNEVDRYGKHYIEDMMLAAEFSGAEVLGKRTYFVYQQPEDEMALINEGNEHAFGNYVASSTTVARRALLRDLPFERKTPDAHRRFLNQASKNGCRIYSADRFNYLRVRDEPVGETSTDYGLSGGVSKQQRGLELSRVMI